MAGDMNIHKVDSTTVHNQPKTEKKEESKKPLIQINFTSDEAKKLKEKGFFFTGLGYEIGQQVGDMKVKDFIRSTALYRAYEAVRNALSPKSDE